MIILDTNIISEIMKSSPNLNVISWFGKQDSTQLFITAITIAEISYGLGILPHGARRKTLEDLFFNTVNEVFLHSVLSFDEQAARYYGEMMSHRKLLGRPLSICDGQIAAIARLHQCSVATRNVTDFLDCNIHVVNPFDR